MGYVRVWWYVWLAAGVFGALYFGQTLRVECRRVEPNQLDCTVQRMWLGMLPLGQPTQIVNFQQARTETRCNQESCVTDIILAGREARLVIAHIYLHAGTAQKTADWLMENASASAPLIQQNIYEPAGVFLLLPLMVGVLLIPGGWMAWRDGREWLRDRQAARRAER